MNILIITGGNSSERKVSLTSAGNVKTTLRENGHYVEVYDLNQGYESIKTIGQKFDLLFPVLHGEEGEGGKLHKFLNSLDLPIVGTGNYEGLENAWHKISFKKYCDKNKIPTAKWQIIKSKADLKKINLPLVLKDSSGGSSREVLIAKSLKDINTKQAESIIKPGNAFAEEYLQGVEITVGILNGRALPVLEIVPKKDSWFSYKTKYDGFTQEIPFAPSVPPKIQKQAQEIALKIHNYFNLGTYSRTDFIVHDNIPYALEINTIPGLTAESLMPKAAKAAGISFNDFLEILINEAQ